MSLDIFHSPFLPQKKPWAKSLAPEPLGFSTFIIDGCKDQIFPSWYVRRISYNAKSPRWGHGLRIQIIICPAFEHICIAEQVANKSPLNLDADYHQSGKSQEKYIAEFHAENSPIIYWSRDFGEMLLYSSFHPVMRKRDQGKNGKYRLLVLPTT